MSHEEREEIREKNYVEALRYMNNAKQTLRKAGKEDNSYSDRKYVRTACGTAYNGMLIALDTYLILKGVKKTKARKSIEYYCAEVGKIDRKLLAHLNNAYDILHLSGYYDGIRNVRVVKEGFDTAYTIIDKIKPEAN
jgi:uncharacterized protein (UPF0332 family)